MISNWSVDTGGSKHIVRDRAGSMDFHCCPLGSQYVVLENNDEEEVLGVGTYKLTLRGGNKLLFFMLPIHLVCGFSFCLWFL